MSTELAQNWCFLTVSHQFAVGWANKAPSCRGKQLFGRSIALINTEGEPWQLWRQQASQSQVPRGARAGMCRGCLTEEAMCRNKMTGGWSDPAAACQSEFASGCSRGKTWRREWKWQQVLNAWQRRVPQSGLVAPRLKRGSCPGNLHQKILEGSCREVLSFRGNVLFSQTLGMSGSPDLSTLVFEVYVCLFVCFFNVVQQDIWKSRDHADEGWL